MRRAVLALGGLLSVAVAARQRPVAHYRHSLRAVALTVVLPDSAVTPGAVATTAR